MGFEPTTPALYERPQQGHALGAKTVKLVHENVHVEVVRDVLETLVMDAQVFEDLLCRWEANSTSTLGLVRGARRTVSASAVRAERDSPPRYFFAWKAGAATRHTPCTFRHS